MKLKAIAILTVIMLLLIMSVPVYADTTLPPLPTDGWEYWVIADTGVTSTVLYYYTSHNPIKVSENDDLILLLDTYKYYYYNQQKNRWEFRVEGTEQFNVHFKSIYASNHDIAYADGSGFFFLSPKVPPLYQEMKKMDFGTILKNFSTGLIPLLGLLILGISLAKAWEFLRTQLKH